MHSDIIGIESSLLKALSENESFSKYRDTLVDVKLLSTTYMLLQDYAKYFEMYPAHKVIDFGVFYTHFIQDWHPDIVDDFTIKYYREDVFPTISKADPCAVHACVMRLHELKIREALASCLASGTSNSEEIVQLSEELQRCLEDSPTGTDKELITSSNVVLSVLDKSKGIPWTLPTLQEALGSIVKGQFIVVTADTDGGKSLFAISQVVETLLHLKRNNKQGSVLYFNSEGTSASVFCRIWSNMYRDTYKDGYRQVVANAEEIRGRFEEEGFSDMLYVVDMSTASITWLKRKVDKVKPVLCIVDITDTLAPEEDPQNLKKVFDFLRRLSATHCPVIGTSQAGKTTYFSEKEGKVMAKKWLTKADLYGSITGKAGAADTIIGIGQDLDMPSQRYISVPKVKDGTPVNISCEMFRQFSLLKELAW